MRSKLDELRPEWLKGLSRDQLERLLVLHAWGIIGMDGLYFLGIEKRHGTEEATAIDTEAWEVYGRLEPERLKAALDIEGDGLEDIAKALRASSWLFYMYGYDIDILDDGKRMVLTVQDCRIQKKRLKKGLPEFPCRPVGEAYLGNFARAFDPKVTVRCRFCPPGEHPEDGWCSWEFSISD
jgi:hypothetical protein